MDTYWKKEHSEPFYKQLAIHIKNKIMSSEYPEGYVFPVFRKMEKLFDTSKVTLSNAFDILLSEGIIIKDGRSFRVAAKSENTTLNSSPWNISAKRFSLVNNNLKESLINGKTLINNEFGFINHYKKAVQTLTATENYHDTCMRKLRAVLMARLRSSGISVNSENIFIVHSYNTALFILKSVLYPPADVIFAAETGIYSLQSGNPKHMKLIKCDNFGLIPKELENHASTARGAVLALEPFCSWPNAVDYPRDRIESILDICRKYNIHLIEIDMQRELYFGEQLPPLTAGDIKGHLYVSQMLSESCHDHIGYFIGPGYLIKHLKNIYLQLSQWRPDNGMRIITDLLASGKYDRYMQTFLPALSKRFNDVYELLNEYLTELAEWNTPKGGIAIVINFYISITNINIPESPCVWFSTGEHSLVFIVTSAPINDIRLFIMEISMQLSRDAHVKK